MSSRTTGFPRLNGVDVPPGHFYAESMSSQDGLGRLSFFFVEPLEDDVAESDSRSSRAWVQHAQSCCPACCSTGAAASRATRLSAVTPTSERRMKRLRKLLLPAPR